MFSADASALPRCGDLLEASVFAQSRRRVFVLSLAPISALTGKRRAHTLIYNL